MKLRTHTLILMILLCSHAAAENKEKIISEYICELKISKIYFDKSKNEIESEIISGITSLVQQKQSTEKWNKTKEKYFRINPPSLKGKDIEAIALIGNYDDEDKKKPKNKVSMNLSDEDRYFIQQVQFQGKTEEIESVEELKINKLNGNLIYVRHQLSSHPFEKNIKDVSKIISGNCVQKMNKLK